jgi:hypothetical protein
MWVTKMVTACLAVAEDEMIPPNKLLGDLETPSLEK